MASDLHEQTVFTRILIPLDRSALAECVLPHAVALVHAFGARVTLLHVVEPPQVDSETQPVDPTRWQMVRTENIAYLEQARANLEAAGVQADAVVLEGKPAETIVTYAQAEKVGLILLSSHGQSGLSRWTISSVAQKVIMQAAISFMLVRAYASPPEPKAQPEAHYAKIMVPLDCSRRAEHVLPVAEELAAHHGSEILLAHVVHRPEIPRPTPLTGEEADLYNRVTSLNLAYAEEYLKDIEARIEAPSRLLLLDRGDVAAALHAWVQDEAPDLVLLNAHGFTGSTAWPYGTVAGSFIVYGEAPLLILQDVAREELVPTQAEVAAQEQAGH